MKNATQVRKLLVGDLMPKAVTDAEKEILATVFDRLIEAPDWAIVPQIVVELVDSTADSDLSGSIPTRRLKSGESIENILEALINAFPGQAGNMPEIVHLAMKNINQDKNFKDDLGQHAVLMTFLFELADFNVFKFDKVTFDKHLIEFLGEGFTKCYFRRSLIYNNQSGKLSNHIAKFITNAQISLKTDKVSNRWDSLLGLLTIARQAFPDHAPMGDASLEYALLNDLCFKMFGTLSPIKKLDVVNGYFNATSAPVAPSNELVTK